MCALSCPDEVLHFPNNEPIEIFYKNTRSYSRCQTYDAKLMTQGYVWHQVVVQHKGKIQDQSNKDSKTLVLAAVFNTIDGEEFYPVAYRMGAREDCFLVRQCKAALDKLFAQNLRIQLSNGRFVEIMVQLNVANYKFGQISPTTKLAQALNMQYDQLASYDGDHGILNLSEFAGHREFGDVVVFLSNRAIFEHVCTSIYKNDDKFRTLNGIDLSNNGLSNLAPLKVFNGVHFAVMNLRNNDITSAQRFCKDVKDIKVNKLLLAGNPLVRSQRYPESLNPVLKNFKLIDGIPAENLSKDYTPLSYDVDVECDGYRIDWTNKSDLEKFQKSCDWHAVLIPDPEEEFTKEQIFDYFFITVSPELNEIYPCFYKFSNGEHQFLLRECHDQLRHLVNVCNLEITIPRLATPPSSPLRDSLVDLTARVEIDKTIVYYLRMNISVFKHGQIEPMQWIERALDKRFNAMDRLLDLENFQNTEGLENLIVNMSSPKVLSRILMLSSRKYLGSCVELRLSRNKIMNINFPKALCMMSSLRAIDLANNWIHDLNGIKELNALSLRSLRLDGNPLCSNYTFAGEYIKAVRAYFPELTRLDNVDVSAKRNFLTQKNFLCDVVAYDFVEQFVEQYFGAFESDQRASLKDLYHAKALFTLTCDYMTDKITTQNFKRISQYANISRNILRIRDLSRAHTSVFVGPSEIINTLMRLPQILHDMLSMSTDTTVFSAQLVVLTVHGAFLDQSILEADILIGFSRTFVLVPVEKNTGELKCSTTYQIINDQLNIFGPTPHQLKNCFKYFKGDAPAVKDTPLTIDDREALLIMFKGVTNLKPIWCTRCLEDGKWDFQKALECFMAMCESKEIPDAAFI